MRLTLRTMLAYLDGILDPADAQELGRKVDESEFATGLVHRIRSATRRPRLGAPNVDGRGIGLDPNTVAEYLDNTMPPDRVPDLEKVCLESDVHLAEVAGCHQILTLVLGEAVDVTPALKERMYRLGSPYRQRDTQPLTAEELADASSVPAPTEPTPPPAVPVPPTPPPEPPPPAISKRELPDYLRVGQNARWKPLAITLLLAFVLSVVALRAMGPFDRHHPVIRLFGASRRAEVATAPTPAKDDEATDQTPTDTRPSQTPMETEAKPEAVEQGTGTDKSAEDPESKATPTKPAAVDAGAGAERAPPVAKPAPVGEPSEQAKMPVEEPAPPPTPPAVEGTAKEVAKPNGEGVAGKEAAAPPAEPAAPAQVEVGYVKDTAPHFLVRLDPASGHWMRLPARTKLMSDDHLVVFPTYRPEIVLAPSVQVVFAGASAVRTIPPSPQGEPGLAFDYGRAMIATAGVAGARIHVDMGGRRGTATFADAASEMGIDVRRFLPPGANPEADVALNVVRIYTTVGKIEWLEAGADTPITIDSGQVRLIVGDESSTLAVNNPPTWMQSDNVRDMNQLASSELEPLLPLDRPVILSLNERSDDRKSEVRSLAARCLAHLDSYESLVKEFNDERQRSYWTAELDELRAATCRSPKAAAAVRDTLHRFCGNEAANLYRLLWGYSPAQLQEGSATELVEFLDHDSLSVRVLAFENLRRITNKTLLFRPETTEARRKSSVQDWHEQLQQGAIVYETLPSPAAVE